MSFGMSDDIGFEEQLRLEALEKESSKKRTRVDEDGTEYEWDESKRAWFPKIDNDFIAEYQMSYGVADSATTPKDSSSTKEGENTASQMSPESYKQYCINYWKQYYNKEGKTENDENSKEDPSEKIDEQSLQAWANYYNSKEYREWYEKVYGTQPESQNETEQETKGEEESKKDEDEKTEADDEKSENEGAKKLMKRKKEPPKWFEMDSEKNNHVYVQNIPEETTDDEFKELMTKVGLIMYDPITRKPKLKLYRDEDGKLKGDGRCCYIKSESVDLALQILDGYNFKGNIISVEKAQFELKGDFNPGKRRKLTKNEKKRAKLQQEKLFAWLPEKSKFIRSNKERVLVMKNAFTIEDFKKVEYLEVLRNRVRQECSRFGGVKKITIYDNNKDGVIKVLFCNAEEVDEAIPYLNGRIFQGRVISAEVWDGRSRYDAKESDDSLAKRDAQWEKYLTEDTNGSSDSTAGASAIESVSDNAPVASVDEKTTEHVSDSTTDINESSQEHETT